MPIVPVIHYLYIPVLYDISRYHLVAADFTNLTEIQAKLAESEVSPTLTPPSNSCYPLHTVHWNGGYEGQFCIFH